MAEKRLSHGEPQSQVKEVGCFVTDIRFCHTLELKNDLRMLALREVGLPSGYSPKWILQVQMALNRKSPIGPRTAWSWPPRAIQGQSSGFRVVSQSLCVHLHWTLLPYIWACFFMVFSWREPFSLQKKQNKNESKESFGNSYNISARW